MKLVLPPGFTQARFDRALAALQRVVGKEWVFATDEDRETYTDPYSQVGAVTHAPSAAVAPSSVEEVQAVLRVANEHKLPLWMISRGKNLGYGGASPRLAGSVVLDLGRLKRIIEVNAELGYCIVEPGVTFYDLHEYLTSNKIDMEVGIPANGWGSVVGNALERGFSWRGDHSSMVCGMEVVLPNGDLVRTGMGSMSNGATWASFMHGFGPSWDQMFVQSNYGVVTKMGLWLHPTPETVIQVRVKLDKPEDLGWYVDAMQPLRLRGVVAGNVAVASYMGSVTSNSQRSEWYQGEGAMPDSVIEEIKTKRNVGWWNGAIRISGFNDVAEANLRLVLDRLGIFTSQEFPVSRSRSADRPSPGPSVDPLRTSNWYGGRGGHIDFSPVMPAVGKVVVEHFKRLRALYVAHGFDYSATFYNNGRTVTNINSIFCDMSNVEQVARADKLFKALLEDARKAGFGEYRTHLSYMDAVADLSDFNNHALRRLNETIKDALDPNGILAPGRNGIWPKALRNQRGVI
jgi:4-cresol dehydrogenase (hydroxylating)